MEHSIALPDDALPFAPVRDTGRSIFSTVEWMVIDISRKDPLSSLARHSPAKRFLLQLLGMRQSAQFAAPRLEALRRMAVALRAGCEKYIGLEERAFYAAGFGAEEFVLLVTIINADQRLAPAGA